MNTNIGSLLGGGHVFTIKENPNDPGSGPEELSYIPSTVNNANKVLLNYTEAGFGEVVIRDENSVIQGSVIVYRQVPIVIKKDRLFTIEYGASGMYATSVGVEG